MVGLGLDVVCHGELLRDGKGAIHSVANAGAAELESSISPIADGFCARAANAAH
jgi:hypothetical protein